MQKELTGKQRAALMDAAAEMHKTDRPYKRAENFDFYLFFVGVIVAALFVRLFVFEPVQVIGPSMYPTLVNGERTFVEKVSYLAQSPQRGDIVICRYPGEWQHCVKRVIGLPGETVRVVFGQILINDQPLEEGAYWNDFIQGSMEAVTVPEDSVFVVGDNRNMSTDSRDVGPIPLCQIIGRVRAVIWPVSNYRVCERAVYASDNPA